MNEAYKIVEHRGFNINIFRDSYPNSPREWDNLGTMYTMHRKYQPEQNFYKHFEWNNVFDEHRDFLPSFNDKYIALKFYLYDHSGQTVSTAPFGCRWDSGLFGIIAVDIERVRDNFGWKKITKERRLQIEKSLSVEIEKYNQYLTGEVYGYIITESCNEDNQLDASCWGFFGDDGIEQLIDDAKCSIDNHLKDDKTIKHSQIFDEVKQFTKELFTSKRIDAELKITY